MKSEICKAPFTHSPNPDFIRSFLWERGDEEKRERCREGGEQMLEEDEREKGGEGEEGILNLKVSVGSQPKTNLTREWTSPGSHDHLSVVGRPVPWGLDHHPGDGRCINAPSSCRHEGKMVTATLDIVSGAEWRCSGSSCWAEAVAQVHRGQQTAATITRRR